MYVLSIMCYIYIFPENKYEFLVFPIKYSKISHKSKDPDLNYKIVNVDWTTSDTL